MSQATKLSEFFESPMYEAALKSYDEFSLKKGWGIGHKLDMYNWSKAAFGSNQPESERKPAFNQVYYHLKQGWQVFRKASRYWSAQQTFDTLAYECQVFSRQSGLSPMTLIPGSEEAKAVLVGLRKLRNLKQTKYYPWMPVAKFTHFFNPSLFPIYDTEIIWKNVLNGVFRDDYYHWCETIGASPLESNTDAPDFNLTYTLMAGAMIREADARFMPYFSTWFKDQVKGLHDKYGILEDMDTYYATAFEFVAIGAAEMRKQWQENEHE